MPIHFHLYGDGTAPRRRGAPTPGGTAGGNCATGGTVAAQIGGTAAQLGGNCATGGTVAARSGGTAAQLGGNCATGGTAARSGGTAAQPGGTAAHTGGTALGALAFPSVQFQFHSVAASNSVRFSSVSVSVQFSCCQPFSQIQFSCRSAGFDWDQAALNITHLPRSRAVLVTAAAEARPAHDDADGRRSAPGGFRSP
eukprot:gene14246-biopygen11715